MSDESVSDLPENGIKSVKRSTSEGGPMSELKMAQQPVHEKVKTSEIEDGDVPGRKRAKPRFTYMQRLTQKFAATKMQWMDSDEEDDGNAKRDTKPTNSNNNQQQRRRSGRDFDSFKF